jgi:type VI secretion system protein ImpA
MSELLDINQLLKPVSDEHPCGEELDDFVFSPEYSELERLAQGREEHVMGDEVIPAEEPDWRAVIKKCEALFDQAKSLRVAVLLTKALTAREGLAGANSGFELISKLLEQYWDDLDPLIDEGDVTERLHTLGELDSSEGYIRLLRQVVLVASAAIGKFTIRDYLIAGEFLKVPAGEDAPQMSSINQALMDIDLEELQDTLAQVDRLVEHTKAIEKSFNGNVEAADQLSLENLVRLCRDIRPVLQETLERRGVATAAGPEGGEAEAAPSGAPAAAPPQAAPGEIHSREDAIKMLDRVTEYFNKNEPSSPVPLLVQRAKRLVSQDFTSILKDLAPGGLKEFEIVSGSKKDKDK